jgi:hypothetical protein
MSYNARFRSRKRNGIVSHSLEIVKNWRDPKKGGEPNHKLIKYIATIDEFNIGIESKQAMLWQKIEAATLNLLKDGTLTQADAQKIVNKFSEFIPHRVKGSLFKPSLPLPRSH